MPPTNSTPITVDNAAESSDALRAILVSAIVAALVVILTYCSYKLYLKHKQKVVEDQVVVMAVNQNKPKPQQDSEPKQEDDILDNEEDDSSDGDSLYVIDTQNGDKTTATNDIAIDDEEGVEREGIAKNETELRQEEKSEKSSSRDSDDIYEGNENSVSDSDQFRVRG
eukprot:884179_1